MTSWFVRWRRGRIATWCKIYCDGCGITTEFRRTSVNAAAEVLRADGWSLALLRDRKSDRCPRCIGPKEADHV